MYTLNQKPIRFHLSPIFLIKLQVKIISVNANLFMNSLKEILIHMKMKLYYLISLAYNILQSLCIIHVNFFRIFINNLLLFFIG